MRRVIIDGVTYVPVGDRFGDAQDAVGRALLSLFLGESDDWRADSDGLVVQVREDVPSDDWTPTIAEFADRVALRMAKQCEGKS